MKLSLFALKSTLATLGVATLAAFGATSVLDRPSYANDATFFCAVSNGVPVTFARTARGNIPMIRWVSNSFGNQWTPLRRCEIVAQRFQRNYDNGTLQGLKSGWLGSSPVVCAASSTDDPCTERTLLFTLQPGSNAELTVERILDARGLAAGRIVEQSSCQKDCSIYVNMSTYLDNARVESDIPKKN